MVFIYLFDTLQQANNANNYLTNLVNRLGIDCTSFSVVRQIPLSITNPTFVGKYYIILPNDTSKKRFWDVLKIRITSLPNYNPDRLFKITREQYNQIIERSDV